MANYSLVINPFQARSFEDMVKPYSMLTEAYEKAQTQFDTIQTATDILENLISKTDDPDTYKLYDSIVKKLDQSSDYLLKNGYGPDSERIFRELRSYYNKNITAIQHAITRRDTQINQLLAAKQKDPSIIPENNILDPKIGSLDKYMKNSGYNFGTLRSPRLEQAQRQQAQQHYAQLLQRAEAWQQQLYTLYTTGKIAQGAIPAKVNQASNLRNMGNYEEANRLLLEAYSEKFKVDIPDPNSYSGEILYSDNSYAGYDDSEYAYGGWFDEDFPVQERPGTPVIDTRRYIIDPREAIKRRKEQEAPAQPAVPQTPQKQTGKSGQAATATSRPKVSSSVPSTVPSNIQQQKAKHDSGSSGSSKVKEKKPTDTEITEEEKTPAIKSANVLPKQLFSPNLVGLKGDEAISQILNILGVSQDLTTDYGDPIKLEELQGSPTPSDGSHKYAVSRQSYKGYSPLDTWVDVTMTGPIKGQLTRDTAELPGVPGADFVQGDGVWDAICNDMVQAFKSYLTDTPATKLFFDDDRYVTPRAAVDCTDYLTDGKKFKLFTNDGWLLTWDSVLRGTGLLSGRHADLQDDPTKQSIYNNAKVLYGIVAKFFHDHVPSRKSKDGSKGYNVNDLFDYIQAYRQREGGPLSISFWEAPFPKEQQEDAIERLLKYAGTITGGGKAVLGVPDTFNIYEIKSWDKEGNLTLSDKKARREDFFVQSKEGDRFHLKDPSAHIYFTGNENIEGPVLYYNDRFYYIDPSYTNSLQKDAIETGQLIRDATKNLDIYMKELVDDFDENYKGDKGTQEYKDALKEKIQSDWVIQEAQQSISDLFDLQVNQARSGLFPETKKKVPED